MSLSSYCTHAAVVLKCKSWLSPGSGYRRLISEICEQTVHWIHFHLDESCRDSLLGRNDANLARVAELYALDRNDARINLGKK